MNNKQLPPELVGKMLEACLGETYLDEIVSHPLSEKCAQVAVDYSTEKCVDYVKQNSELHFENRILKQQRDELLEALRESKRQIIKLKAHYHDIGHSVKHLINIDELIKKYGK